MNQQKREEIFRRWQSANPHPSTELVYHNGFELLIAIILSAQSTDLGVNKATPRLFALAPTPAAMATAPLERIKSCIASLGLYNSKAKNIRACAQILQEQHGGMIPETRQELEALPGVGAKTAGVYLNVALGHSEIPVDTHVFRVANRTGITKAHNEKQTELQLGRRVPRWATSTAHHWMILHGRYVCTARKPQCPTCAIADLCDYRQKTPLKTGKA